MADPLHKITAAPLFKYLRTAGGVSEMTGNYAAAAETFFVQPAADQDFVITDIVAHFTFTGTNLTYGSYAGIAGGLANGITLQTYGTGVIFDVLGGELITINDDFVHIAGGLEVFNFASNLQSYSARLFTTDQNALYTNVSPITLKGANSEQLQAILNDDFSTLTDHHITIKGYINDSGGYR